MREVLGLKPDCMLELCPVQGIQWHPLENALIIVLHLLSVTPAEAVKALGTGLAVASTGCSDSCSSRFDGSRKRFEWLEGFNSLKVVLTASKQAETLVFNASRRGVPGRSLLRPRPGEGQAQRQRMGQRSRQRSRQRQG